MTLQQIADYAMEYLDNKDVAAEYEIIITPTKNYPNVLRLTFKGRELDIHFFLGEKVNLTKVLICINRLLVI